MEVDVVVVGAGIVGIAHAVEALGRGASVAVVERDALPLGASVRSLGHVSFTAQDGPALAYGLHARDRWIALGRQAGYRAEESGSVVVARGDDELAVLENLVAARDGAARLLDRSDLARQLPKVGDDVVGGALLATDLTIDPREAVRALADWLGDRPRASVVTSTSVLGVEPGNGRTLVRTSRGDIVARRVVLAVGHDVDRLFPAVAEAHGLARRTRQVLRVQAADGVPAAAVLDRTALLHYPGFTRSPQHRAVHDRLEAAAPDVLAAGLNLRVTRLGDGSLLLGDTSGDGQEVASFRDEARDDLLLREGERLLGTSLRVVERWTATEAAAPEPFVVAQPQRGLLVVAVTRSSGLSTAFGLAPRALDGFL